MSHENDQCDIVNDEDVVVGRASRRECHGNPALIHRAVHVLVFDSQGRLFLQKRVDSKPIQPGRWDSSVGGHVEPGETYLQAARREMDEELGLRGLPLTFLYRSRIRNAIESENIETYLARYDGKITFNPDEISDVKAWSPDQIESALGSGQLTPNFEEEWTMYKEYVRRFQVGSVGNRCGFCAGDSFPGIIQELHGKRDLPD